MNALAFLRLTDENNQLSLTSIFFMVAIARLALFAADVNGLGILTLAAANYAHKKILQSKILQSKIIAAPEPIDLSLVYESITALEKSVSKLAKDVSTIKSTDAIKALTGR